MPSDLTRLRILHVAESFGGGVGAAVVDYVKATPEFDHDLVYAERADAPISRSALEAFRVAHRLPRGQWRRILHTRKIIRGTPYAVVHAHSSFGGAYARLAVPRSRHRIVYTPHCYAYERTDVGGALRSSFRLLERALGLNTSAILACSDREARISVTPRSTPRIFVPNVAPLDQHAAPSRPRARGPLRVVGSGRAGAQKDPEFFFRCIASARNAGVDIDATWVGGDDRLIESGRIADVRVTGWVERAEVLRHMSEADLYLHTAAWEGFPVAVLEAVALGTPTVVRAIPAFEGTGLPSFETPQDFGRLAPSLSTEVLDEILAVAAASLRGYDRATQRSRLLDGYLIGNPSAPMKTEAT